MLDALKKFANEHILADTPEGATQAPAKPQTTAQVGTAGTATVNTQSVPVSVNNEYLTLLRNAIKARSTAFTALVANADKLANVIPDSAMRLKAAFEMVKGDGRGLKEIMGAIDVHLADLESQRMQFGAAMTRQKQTAIGVLQSEFDSLAPANQTAASQIQALQQQIAALQETMNRNTSRAAELQSQITTEGMRFTTAEQQFETALQIVKTELEGQKAVVGSTLN